MDKANQLLTEFKQKRTTRLLRKYQTRGNKMKVFIIQFKQAGGDYEVRAFRTQEEAEGFALDFLESFVWSPEEFETLNEMKSYCEDKDLAYINITWDII